MKRLSALARALAIVAVALLPAFGAAFQLVAGAPRERAPAPPPVGHFQLVGSYLAMSPVGDHEAREPGIEGGGLALGFVSTTVSPPPGAAPALPR
jgi:hypothetical protein